MLYWFTAEKLNNTVLDKYKLDTCSFLFFRYPDVYSDLGTPASSLSPDSTCLHSPYSPYTFHMDSPPPTAAEFIEYFNAPATYMEKDFSQLTLSGKKYPSN